MKELIKPFESRSKEGLEKYLAGGLGMLDLLFSLGRLLGDFLPAENLCVRVEAEEGSLVDEGVVADIPAANGGGDRLGRADNRLDFVRVNDTGNIGVGDFGGGEEVVLLEESSLVKGTEDLIEESKGALSPDDEATDVATGSKLEEVESPDVGELNTGQVPESFDDAEVFAVDDQGTAALTVPSVPELSLTGAELAGVGDLDDIGVSVDSLQEGDSLFGLLVGLDAGRDDKRNLGDLLDAVTAGKDEGWDSGGGKGRDDSEATLVLVDLYMPLAPDFGGSEHATTTAHVTESSLARAVSTTTANTGNTRYSPTSTPRLSAGLVASVLGHGISLALVFGDALVYLMYDIEPNRSSKDGRESKRAGRLS